jgi:hypothetical protein
MRREAVRSDPGLDSTNHGAALLVGVEEDDVEEEHGAEVAGEA